MAGRTILIVDDHSSFRGLARAVLESDGFEVVGEARDARSARELARSLHPDVVLLDIQLPDGDGFEVAADIAAMDGAPAIVLTSSRDQAEFGPLVVGSGARGFVPKADLSGQAIADLVG